MGLDRYRTTMQTVNRSLALKIPRAQFERWLATDIVALKKEARLVAEYLHEETRNSRAFLFLQGSDRVALLLINRYDKYAENGILRMKGSRKELSDSTGLCLKTINRSVKKFCDDGVITSEGRNLIINHEQYLKLKQIVTTILAEDN